MDTVIVAFESDSLCRKFRDLLEGSGSAACLICHSGSQVRRAAAAQPIYCVVCGTRLSDGPAEWLCGDLPPFCSLLMVGPALRRPFPPSPCCSSSDTGWSAIPATAAPP